MLNFTKSKSNMKIGNKIRIKRNRKKLSQQEVADYLHVSQRTYSNFESDKSEPSLTQLSKLAEILEFNLLDMLQEQGLVFNQTNNEFKDNSNGIVVNNNDSDKLFLQLEKRIKSLEEVNSLLRDKIDYLEKRGE